MSVEYTYPSQNIHQTAASVFDPAQALAKAKTAGGGGDFSFKDILDTINPLQQLPIVGSIYRAITGDTVSAASQIMGGALFGGPIGFAVAALTSGITSESGKNPGETLLAMATGGSNDANMTASRQYAAAQYQKMQWLS